MFYSNDRHDCMKHYYYTHGFDIIRSISMKVMMPKVQIAISFVLYIIKLKEPTSLILYFNYITRNNYKHNITFINFGKKGILFESS